MICSDRKIETTRGSHSERGAETGLVLLHKKEVIQPHLPVRLPCYDLAPVMSLTLGTLRRLQVLPTSIA